MLRKLIEPEVIKEDPWSDDALQRRPVAEKLTQILETVDGPLVASVVAPFGMGKTFFARRWVTDLNSNQTRAAIYFNAWETDYAENPLVAFMAVLRAEVEKFDLSPTKKASITKRVKQVVKVGAPALAKTAVKAGAGATGFLLAGDKVDDIWEAAIKGVVEEAEKFATAQIDAFTNEQESRQKFKEELAKLREAIVEARSSKATNGSEADEKIYIIIDELDRCRPPYALEFLEAIKHLFDVKGFVFVLMMDEERILESARTLFGAVGTGEDYLRKFIDYRFRLPPPTYDASAKFLYEAFRLPEVITANDGDTFFGRRGLEESFSFFAARLSLSLRTQVHAFSLIDLVLRAYGEDNLPVLSALVCIREGRPEIWKNLISKQNDFDQIAREYGFDTGSTYETDDQEFYNHALMRAFFVGTKLNMPRYIDDQGARTEVDRNAVELLEHLRLDRRPNFRFEVVHRLVSHIEILEELTGSP